MKRLMSFLICACFVLGICAVPMVSEAYDWKPVTDQKTNDPNFPEGDVTQETQFDKPVQDDYSQDDEVIVKELNTQETTNPSVPEQSPQ